MNDHDLKDLWQRQKLADAPPVDARAQIDAMRARMSELHRTLKKRDYGELVGCVFVIIVFGAYFFIFSYPLAQIGSLINIAGALLVSWKLMAPRRPLPEPDAGAPVGVWLKQEREQVHHNAELLRTVLWWYLLPFWVGTNLFFWGLPNQSLALSIFFTGMCTLMYLWIYRLNLAARKKLLLPLQDELETLMQNESPHDSQSTTAEKPSGSASAERRNWHSNAWILLAAFVAISAVIYAAWLSFNNSRAESLLRVPPFEDVSAFTPDDLARVDAWLEEQLALAKYPSLSVAIVRDGEVIHQRAFGFENMKARRKATPQTSYNVASVTKAFTASLAVMLHARGVVDLDQPVLKYLPDGVSISDTPEVGATITLRQLASHTSGLPRGVPGPVQSIEGRYQLEPERLYDHLSDVTMEFDPGADELYSNLGFGLLGHALELAAGKPFDQLLQEMLCDPLRLEGTAIHVADLRSVATGYSSDYPRRERTHSYRQRLAPSGGLITSAEDLAKFLSAQMKPGVFTSEMLAQLHTPSRLANGSTARHALGWTIRSRGPNGRILEKNGGRNNCGAWIGFSPEHKVGVAVITNCGGPDLDPIGRWLLERSIPGGHKPAAK